MTILTKAEVVERIFGMKFTPKREEKVHKVVAFMDDSGRISTETLATVLRWGEDRKTIADNTQTLLKWINDAAKLRDKDTPLKAVLASDESGWSGVQVEWNEIPPPEAMIQDLKGSGPLITLPASSDLMQTDDAELGSVVLVTCNDYEGAAVDHFFGPSGEGREVTKQGRTYTVFPSTDEPDTPHTKRGSIIMVRSGIGPLAAAGTVENAWTDWKPQLVIGVGIAWGSQTDPEQCLGEVMVSKAAIQYGENVRSGRKRSVRVDPFRAPDACVNRMHLRDQQGKNQSSPWPQVRYGTILTTNQKISNTLHRNKLLRLYKGHGIIGGDMEGAGIASACENHKIPWLIVKAVSDFGSDDEGDDGKDERQKGAALNAARVVYAFLTRIFPVEPLEATSGDSLTPMPFLNDAGGIPNEKRLINRAYQGGMGSPLFEGKSNSSFISGDTEIPPDDPNLRPDILADLDEWINDESGKPLFAIFGDLGMGKTVTCQSFAQKQREVCKVRRSSAWPLYFDLRKVEVTDGVTPTLVDTMLQCAHRGWERAENVTEEQLWSWIDRGAVVIFDGLDEVLTKLDKRAGQMYTDNLLSVINQAKTDIRVLISSRSQFFRNLEEERTRFTGAERNDKDASWYEARWLLPLTKGQIRVYFEASLKEVKVDMNVDQVMFMVSEVHNLSDLSRRPYTLKLVADAIPEIAQQRDQGLLVNGSTIYRKFARKWLRRDDLKHHIDLEDKLYLVEELAARLWVTGLTQIPVKELERWFNNWKKNREGWEIYEEISRDKLEEDLRNSTFLSRVDVSETQGAFRFAHTSLAEFFLSEYMLRALEENASERWAMKPPSQETYDFMGMSLAEKDEPTRQELLSTMGSWFTGTDATINTAILNYRFHAGWDGLPQVTLPLIRPQVESLSVDEARRLLKTMKKGEHVCVGGYSWSLLGKGRETAFLLCDQIVDYQPYNTELADVTWQTCTLRTWLNHDFLSTLPQGFQDAVAFVDASSEKAKVVTSPDGTDKLFLLSMEEAEGFLPKEDTHIAYRHDGDTWWWWLRSVGRPRDGAPVVGRGGTLGRNGNSVRLAGSGVRPALKMNL